MSPLSDREQREVASSLLKLQRGLTGDRELAGSGYMENDAFLGAYLLYYWPVSYIELSLILEELAPLLPTGSWRALDLGSGPGPASAALLDAGARTLRLADSSQAALDLAALLLGAEDSTGAVRADYRRLDLETGEAVPAGPYDLVVLSHTLNELWREEPDRQERRLRLLERAAAVLAPGGILLVVEPAPLASSREALTLRDILAASGYRIVAPCPGSYPCPALAAGPSRTCHLEAPWDPPEPVASLAAAAGLDRSSVKCTWFALRNRDEGEAAIDGAEGARGALPSRLEIGHGRLLGARIVSEALLNKAGRLRIFLCAEGGLRSLSAARDDGHARKLGFFDLGRGDVINLEGAETRPGGGLGIGLATRLEIVRRAPRPENLRHAVSVRDTGRDHPRGPALRPRRTGRDGPAR